MLAPSARRAARGLATVARSLAAAFAARATVRVLDLRGSADLVCANIMCGGLGGACVCRLALALSRLQALEELDVRGAALAALPTAALAALPALARVDARGNPLGAAAAAEARAALGARLVLDGDE